MRSSVEFLALLITGPMVGVEFAVAALLNPVLGRLPDAAFRQARSDGSRVLGKVMPFWYATSLVSLIAAAVVVQGEWVFTGAAITLALVVLMTVTLMVPINNRIGRWAVAGDESRDLAGRWDLLHWLRVVLLVGLFALLTAGVTF